MNRSFAKRFAKLDGKACHVDETEHYTLAGCAAIAATIRAREPRGTIERGDRSIMSQCGRR